MLPAGADGNSFTFPDVSKTYHTGTYRGPNGLANDKHTNCSPNVRGTNIGTNGRVCPISF